VEQLYIGVDLHSRFFQACAVTGSGERRWEERFMRTDPGFEQSAAAVIDQHARRRAVFRGDEPERRPSPHRRRFAKVRRCTDATDMLKTL